VIERRRRTRLKCVIGRRARRRHACFKRMP